MREFVVTWEPLASLRRWERNPNNHPPGQIEHLASAIGRFGFLAPVLVAEVDGEHPEVRAGHGRMLALEQLVKADPEFVPRNAPPGTAPGSVPVVRAHFATRAEADMAGIADNRIAELAEPDDALITRMLREMAGGDLDLSGLGFDEGDLSTILGPGVDDTHDYTRIKNQRLGSRPPVLALMVAVPQEAEVLDQAFARAAERWPMLSRGGSLVEMLREWLAHGDAEAR